jgi:parvulin-like peptidyl-prolyl isomerase
MMRATGVGLAFLAIVLGIAAGEAIVRSEFCRDLIGRCYGRGHLLTLVHGHGIYESEVNREIAATRYLSGQHQESLAKEAIMKRLIASENLRQAAAHQPLSGADLQPEFDSMRHELGDDNSWRQRLSSAGETQSKLCSSLGENIRGRDWIEHSIADRPVIDEPTLHQFYEEKKSVFVQPRRFRASHIFLFAPPKTAPEIVEAKQKLINSLNERLRGGEEFNSLVWEASEDGATRPRGGDLGYFSESRIPSDFFEIVSHMKVGEMPKVIRTSLGFHIVRLTEMKPARQMSYAEVRRDILIALRNSNRRQMVRESRGAIGGTSALRARWFWN